MGERINFITTKEMKEKIEAAAKINKQNSSDIIRTALDFYFQKQEEQEVLNAILQRLDFLKFISVQNEIHSYRMNTFMNYSYEKSMPPEEYKELKEKISKDTNNHILTKGYDRI